MDNAGLLFEHFDGDVGVRLVRSGGEIVEEWMVHDRAGRWRTVLLSPTHPTVTKAARAFANAVDTGAPTLFASLPSSRFTEAEHEETPEGAMIMLKAEGGGVRTTKTIRVPRRGSVVRVEVETELSGQYPAIRVFAVPYVFAPDGKVGAEAMPDHTYLPSYRPQAGGVAADHFFRTAGLVVQRGRLAVVLAPDVDDLERERRIPAFLDLDASGKTFPAPLLVYGFGNVAQTGHVYYTHVPAPTPSPRRLRLAMDVILEAEAEPFTTHGILARHAWDRYGSPRLERILPQAMPFAQYAETSYPAAFTEKVGDQPLGWFEREIDGHVCGGLASGWYMDRGWIHYQCWFAQHRSALGLRFWGKRLKKTDWVEKSEKMLSLALAAPLDRGASPTTYRRVEEDWRPSLIVPSPECHYDLASLAWKGIWLLRWHDEVDCPRRADVRHHLDEIAALFRRQQHEDGSFPCWIDAEHRVARPLDQTASSALPGWFLAERAVRFKEPVDRDAAVRASDFLLREVVDRNAWYDFETFYSCSPKPFVRGTDGKPDHEAMRDPHSRQLPQNTLCMQWAAEALRSTAKLGGGERHRKGALKALDALVLYQSVWSPPFRPLAYVYGGFAVQNSDGEFNDARQAQFGETLCDFGVEYDRKDLFERGVAATRASLALINHPLHRLYGIYPDPNYPYGLMPENMGHRGAFVHELRAGHDWGEGSGLASMAFLREKYGATYRHASGWEVVIDGTLPPVEFPKDPVYDAADGLEGWRYTGNFVPWPFPWGRALFENAGRPFLATAEDGHAGNDGFTGTADSPVFVLTKPGARLRVGGGKGEGVGVELLRADDGRRLAVARGENAERIVDVHWNVPEAVGVPVRLRVFDRETTPWGHVTFGGFWPE